MDPFEGLDESEREIMEREIRDGHAPMPVIERIDPLICAKCKHSLVRGVSTSGKGRYTCPNPKCEDSFKVWHVRESGSERPPAAEMPTLDVGKERRDLRDPAVIGAKLLNSVETRAECSQHVGRPCTMSELYDFAVKRGLDL